MAYCIYRRTSFEYRRPIPGINRRSYTPKRRSGERERTPFLLILPCLSSTKYSSGKLSFTTSRTNQYSRSKCETSQLVVHPLTVYFDHEEKFNILTRYILVPSNSFKFFHQCRLCKVRWTFSVLAPVVGCSCSCRIIPCIDFWVLARIIRLYLPFQDEGAPSILYTRPIKCYE